MYCEILMIWRGKIYRFHSRKEMLWRIESIVYKIGWYFLHIMSFAPKQRRFMGNGKITVDYWLQVVLNRREETIILPAK